MATYTFGNVQRKVDKNGRETFTEGTKDLDKLFSEIDYNMKAKSGDPSYQDTQNHRTSVTIGEGKNARTFSYGGAPDTTRVQGADNGTGISIRAAPGETNAFTGVQESFNGSQRRQMFQAAREIGRTTQREMATWNAAKNFGLDTSTKEFKDFYSNIGAGAGASKNITDAVGAAMQKRFGDLVAQAQGVKGGTFDSFQARQAEDHQNNWSGVGAKPADGTNGTTGSTQTGSGNSGSATTTTGKSRMPESPKVVRTSGDPSLFSTYGTTDPATARKREAERRSLERGSYMFSGEGQRDQAAAGLDDLLKRTEAANINKISSQIRGLLQMSKDTGIELNLSQAKPAPEEPSKVQKDTRETQKGTQAQEPVSPGRNFFNFDPGEEFKYTRKYFI